MIRTFSVGKQPIKLLDLVPAGSTIINTASDAIVWASGDPGVSASNGFPVQPLSSMDKPKDGPLYAVLDPSATELAVTVLVGDDLSGYSNPVALAAAVATELAATGIPNKLLETVLFDGNIVASTGVFLDVSDYATLTINLGAGGQLVQGPIDDATITTVSTYWDYFQGVARVSVVDKYIWISAPNYGASSISLTVTGSNRAMNGLIDNRQQINVYDVWNLPTTVMAAGQDYQFTNPTPIATLQGLVYGRFALTQAGNTVKGYWSFSDVNGNLMAVCDTSECITGASGLQVGKLFAIPGGITGLRFHCTTAGTSASNLVMSQATF